jgi:hypothetical protein
VGKTVGWLKTSLVKPILSYALLVWWKRVELKNAQKRLSLLQRMTCLGITGGMRSTPTSVLEVMLMLPPLYLFIKQEARQVANRLLGNGCSYVPNFGHSEILIKITDEMPLLLAPRNTFVTLNIFGRKFSVDIPTREDWSTECVDLVAPDGLVFFTDESLCLGRTGAGVFSDILNVRESYALGSHVTVYQSKVYAFLACSEGIVNRAVSICSDSRAVLLALKSYAVSSRVVLQCGDSLQELALSNRVRLVWANALARVGSSSAFVGP